MTVGVFQAEPFRHLLRQTPVFFCLLSLYAIALALAVWGFWHPSLRVLKKLPKPETVLNLRG